MDITGRIIKCLVDVGIIIDENEKNFQLTDYIEDSLAFIDFIVALEEEFNVEIADEYLLQGVLGTLEDVKNMIEKLLDI